MFFYPNMFASMLSEMFFYPNMLANMLSEMFFYPNNMLSAKHVIRNVLLP